MTSSSRVITIPFVSSNKNIDLKDVLTAIGIDRIVTLAWGLKNVWWLGENFPDFDTEKKIIISGKMLAEAAAMVEQTLEGTFVGYNSERDAQEFLGTDWRKAVFDKSSAELIIDVVDGLGFDIYLRRATDAENIIRCFPNVMQQNPTDFFVEAP
jgi:hypothetical protein